MGFGWDAGLRDLAEEVRVLPLEALTLDPVLPARTTDLPPSSRSSSSPSAASGPLRRRRRHFLPDPSNSTTALPNGPDSGKSPRQ